MGALPPGALSWAAVAGDRGLREVVVVMALLSCLCAYRHLLAWLTNRSLRKLVVARIRATPPPR